MSAPRFRFPSSQANPIADPDGRRLPWWIPRAHAPSTEPAPNAVRLVRGPGAEVVVKLEPARTYHVGRDLDSDLRFDSELVSRLHAVLYFCAEVGAWAFCDVGSTHGSVLLGGRGDRPKELAHHEPMTVVAGSTVQLASREISASSSSLSQSPRAPRSRPAGSPRRRGTWSRPSCE